MGPTARDRGVPVTKVPVPPLWCPIPESVNPSWQRMQAGSDAWAARWGLADGPAAELLPAIGAGELAARVTAHAQPGDGPQFAADQLTWLFAFDDVFCDEGRLSHNPAGMSQLAASLVRTAQTGRTDTDGPIPLALADLRRRLDALGTPVQAARWVNSLRDYLFYQVWECVHRATDSTPELAAYLVARISNGSMPVCVSSLDFTNGYTVSAEELETPTTRALSEMCCAIVGYDNDIMSHWKETLRSGDGINLVDTLARHNYLPTAAALQEAVALRDRVMARYLYVRDQTLPTVSPDIRRYIGGLDSWIRGNLDWGMRSRRYLNPGNPALLPSSPIADHPDATPDSGPLPGVAWWWHATQPGGDDLNPKQ